MSKYLTIQLHSKTKIAIDKLAEKNNKSILKTVDEMVIYFEKTGINPI